MDGKAKSVFNFVSSFTATKVSSLAHLLNYAATSRPSCAVAVVVGVVVIIIVIIIIII